MSGIIDNKITYNKLLNTIEQSKGSLVSIVYDFNTNHIDLIQSFTSDLGLKCRIVNYYDVDINNSLKDNIFNRRDDKIIKMINEKYILIVLMKNYKGMNFSGRKLTYCSNLILSLNDKKLKILKSRYSDMSQYDSCDINILLRKIKLKNLNKKAFC